MNWDQYSCKIFVKNGLPNGVFGSPVFVDATVWVLSLLWLELPPEWVVVA